MKNSCKDFPGTVIDDEGIKNKSDPSQIVYKVLPPLIKIKLAILFYNYTYFKKYLMLKIDVDAYKHIHYKY